MEFDKLAKTSLLYDCYGQLLTDRQRQAMALYYEENLTLSEIADEFSISRQGVHDALKNAEKSLLEYEAKLKLVEKLDRNRKAAVRIDRVLNEMIDENGKDTVLTAKLKQIKTIIADFNQ